MASAKIAFSQVRNAIEAAKDPELKLQELWALQHSTLGRDSEFSNLKAELKQKIDDLPARDPGRKKLRNMVSDLNAVARELREQVTSSMNVLRMGKASKRDERTAARKQNAVERILKDFEFLKSEDALLAEAILAKLTASADTVTEVTDEITEESETVEVS